ncbi:hypothetical protein MAR_003140 [Mya arenaria]|uniref:Protein kinase domain-containing protein n=1 Tax=Mya arenaria TaxID=6604 RepID=A0ABY7G556_MYAAR|nr:hypothetical protein MAR_003140 [Mya arenaria]
MNFCFQAMSFAAFNGKAAELNERVFKLLESVCMPIKEKGTTLVSQGSVPFYDTSLVIHKAEKTWTDDTTAEKIKVQLEQRYLHYAIVPQVAYYRNEETVSFVSPYFRGGSLEKAIQKETDKIQDKPTAKPQTLDLNEKLRILYQICCAINYLHEPPDCDRKAVTHVDISLKRVLLDEQKNARLLFFTPSSVEGDEKFTNDKSKDVQDFITVLCSVLKDTPGREAEKLSKYASDKDVTLKKISDKLEGLVGRNNIDRWTRSQDAKKKKEKVITVKKSTTNYTEQLDNAFRDIDTQERLNLSEADRSPLQLAPPNKVYGEGIV